MAYSRIQPKKKQLGCGCFDYNFSRNRCRRHAAIEDKKPIQSKPATKKDIDLKLVDAQEKLALDQFFARERLRMKGYCCNCGGRTAKHDPKYYRWCIAHVLPKAIFKSVATHPDGWLELCTQCHTLYDRNIETASKMKCWGLAVVKFSILEPLITERHKHLDVFRSKLPN